MYNNFEKIKLLIEQYFEMKDGEKIDNYLEEIIFENIEIHIILKRRVLKHIVEKRKRDEYDKNKIINIFNDLNIILNNYNYKIIKNNKDNIDDFFFIEKIIDKNEGLVLALEIKLLEENKYYIKTAFYRSTTKIKKIS